MARDELGAVVIGRNEGQRLIRCLSSLAPQVGSIVYVDSGSTDKSVMVAQGFGAKVVELDLDTPFTAARARNQGLAFLKGAFPTIEFVQFVDGDCTLDPDWLKKALTFIQSYADVAVVCGRRREIDPDASVYNRIFDIEWDTPLGEATACGGDALVRIAAFQQVSGFRADLIAGEEPELCARLRASGWKIWRLDAEMTRHDAAVTRFGQWWRRSVRSGYGYAEGAVVTRSSRFKIWHREIASILFWACLVPLAIALGTLVTPAATLGLLIYPIQIARIAAKQQSDLPWTYATLMMLAKFAGLQGALKFVWGKVTNSGAKPIEYKTAGR